MKSFPFNILTAKERKIFSRLTTPQKIQDFLDSLPINFEEDGETLYSPRELLKNRSAHCIEGALLGAAALWFHGHPPLLMDFQTIPEDEDHVITLFKEKSGWGALSKTNHAILRYRDPVYKTPRELAMSYFHEYQHKGKKSLRAFSKPFDLSKLDSSWLVSEKDLFPIAIKLDDSPHIKILEKINRTILRPISSIEKKSQLIVEWTRDKKRLN